MSESLSYVRNIFEEDLKGSYHHKRSGSVLTEQKKVEHNRNEEKNSNLYYYDKYPKIIPSPHLISSITPHHHSPALPVLLNIILRRFLDVLRKQIYLSQIFIHKSMVRIIFYSFFFGFNSFF